MKKVGKTNAKNTDVARLGRPISDHPKNIKLPVRFARIEVESVRSAAAKQKQSIADYVRDRLGLPSTGYSTG